jgi:hypothetical protein
MTTGGDFGNWKESFLESIDPGVSGAPGPRGVKGSDDCLRRERLNIPPKLGLPEVEVDVLVDCVSCGACSGPSSSIILLKELIVEDRPLPSRSCCLVAEVNDLADREDALESLRRSSSTAGCLGECWPLLLGLDPPALSADTPNELLFGDSDGLPLDSLGVPPKNDPAESTLGGSGKRGPLSCFRLGSLKNVVLLARLFEFPLIDARYTPFSPELLSDLDDSDRRAGGIAKEELFSLIALEGWVVGVSFVPSSKMRRLDDCGALSVLVLLFVNISANDFRGGFGA